MAKTHTGCPPPLAQTAQPVRWRMRRWSKEPRRISVTGGRAAASLARASGMSLCFILSTETHGPLFVNRNLHAGTLNVIHMNEIDMLGPGTKHEPPRRPAALQGGSELAVVGQPLLDYGFQLGGAVDLPSAAAGIETVKTQRRRSRMADAVGASSRGG